MKKIVTGAVAALIGTALAVAMSAQPASAAPNATDTSASIELTITDRPDSGTGTPTVWAKDTFTREVVVTTEAEYANDSVAKVAPVVLCDVVKQDGLLWEYVAVVKDSGTFVTTSGSATGSPGLGKPLTKDATGTFIGGATATILAPAHWCTWDGDKYDGGKVSGELTGSTSQFLGKLFGGKSDKVDLTTWAWTYERCAGTASAEKWVNALAGNTGDIVGLVCPSPSASPSTSPSASASPTPAVATLPVTGANSMGLILTAATLLVGGGAVLGGLAIWNRRRQEDGVIAE